MHQLNPSIHGRTARSRKAVDRGAPSGETSLSRNILLRGNGQMCIPIGLESALEKVRILRSAWHTQVLFIYNCHYQQIIHIHSLHDRPQRHWRSVGEGLMRS
jgi:hypothetical protein